MQPIKDTLLDALFGKSMLILVAGICGALFLSAIRIPAGALLGAILASGMYSLAGGQKGSGIDIYRRIGLQMAGTFIGASISLDMVTSLGKSFIPVLLITIALIGLGVTIGWALFKFTNIDLATAVLSSSPGGFPAMVGLAQEIKADSIVVFTLHYWRIITITATVPLLAPHFLTGSSGELTQFPQMDTVNVGSTIIAIFLGLIAGFFSSRANIPMGDLLGPILALGVVNLLGFKFGPLPDKLIQTAMVLIGISMGNEITWESFRRLQRLAIPAGALIVVFILGSILLGALLAKLTALDLTTAVLSSIPGGAVTMPVIAHDLGGDMRVVAAIHLLRLLSVFVALPGLLRIFFRWAHNSN
jgi:membrane AbrB-like protein